MESAAMRFEFSSVTNKNRYLSVVRQVLQMYEKVSRRGEGVGKGHDLNGCGSSRRPFLASL